MANASNATPAVIAACIVDAVGGSANITNLTQLPQTGGVLAFAFWLACAMPLFAIGGTMAVRGARNRRDALTLTHDGGNPAA